MATLLISETFNGESPSLYERAIPEDGFLLLTWPREPYVGSIVIEDISRVAADPYEVEGGGNWPATDFMVAITIHDGLGEMPRSARICFSRRDGATDLRCVKGRALPLLIGYSDAEHTQVSVFRPT